MWESDLQGGSADFHLLVFHYMYLLEYDMVEVMVPNFQG